MPNDTFYSSCKNPNSRSSFLTIQMCDGKMLKPPLSSYIKKNAIRCALCAIKWR